MISILVTDSIEVNLVLLNNASKILLFLKEKKKKHVYATKMPSYRSMNCHYGVHSAIRSFSEFYQRVSIFAKPKLLAEFKIELSEIVLAQGFLLIHKYFSTETMQDKKLLVLHCFWSTKILLPGLVWTRRGIAVRCSDLVNLWICSQTFQKFSFFSVSITPAVSSSLNPYSYRVM